MAKSVTGVAKSDGKLERFHPFISEKRFCKLFFYDNAMKNPKLWEYNFWSGCHTSYEHMQQ